MSRGSETHWGSAIRRSARRWREPLVNVPTAGIWKLGQPVERTDELLPAARGHATAANFELGRRGRRGSRGRQGGGGHQDADGHPGRRAPGNSERGSSASLACGVSYEGPCESWTRLLRECVPGHGGSTRMWGPDASCATRVITRSVGPAFGSPPGVTAPGGRFSLSNETETQSHLKQHSVYPT